MRINVQQPEKWLEHLRQKLFAYPAQCQTRQGYTELRRGKISIEMAADIFGKAGPQIPLLHQRIELTRAHFDDGKFARNEKTVKREQRRDHRQFPNHDSGRIPMRQGRISKWMRCQGSE